MTTPSFMTATPTNTITDDLYLLCLGYYGLLPSTRLEDRFKIAVMLVLYHDRKARAPMAEDFGGVCRDPERLRWVLNRLSTECQQTVLVSDRSTAIAHLTAHEGYYEKRAQRYQDRYDRIDTYRSGIEYYLDMLVSEFDLEHLWPSRLTMACNGLTADSVDPVLFESINRMLTWDIGRISLGRENRQLRELLAYRVGGEGIYSDDGELSDSTSHPSIDFRRASPAVIKAMLRRRGRDLHRNETGVES